MRRVLFPACLLTATLFAQSPPAWVAKSNLNAQLLIDVNAKYSPEDATSDGVKTLDDQVSSVALSQRPKIQADLQRVKQELGNRFKKEKDPLVKQDLQILFNEVDRNIRTNEASFKTFLPYTDVTAAVFFGVKTLLDDQIAPERRPAALVRMKKYAGLEPGYVPIATQAE